MKNRKKEEEEMVTYHHNNHHNVNRILYMQASDYCGGKKGRQSAPSFSYFFLFLSEGGFVVYLTSLLYMSFRGFPRTI